MDKQLDKWDYDFIQANQRLILDHGPQYASQIPASIFFVSSHVINIRRMKDLIKTKSDNGENSVISRNLSSMEYKLFDEKY